MRHIRRFNESQTIKATDNTILEIVKEEINKLGDDADLNHIDVSEITSMSSLFYRSKFNGNISRWNVENVKNMSWMFYCSQFNGDISNWNVKNVEDMGFMFCRSNLNGDISNWNVENVWNMELMFSCSKFNGDLDKWKPKSITNIINVFRRSPLMKNKPIWYLCLELGLFKSGEDYCDSLVFDWLRSNKTISRFRLEESIKYFGGEIKNINHLKGYTFVN